MHFPKVLKGLGHKKDEVKDSGVVDKDPQSGPESMSIHRCASQVPAEQLENTHAPPNSRRENVQKQATFGSLSESILNMDVGSEVHHLPSETEDVEQYVLTRRPVRSPKLRRDDSFGSFDSLSA